MPNLRHCIVSSLATTSFHLPPSSFLLLTLMFVLEEPKSKKRRRSSTHSEESHPIAKKQKPASESHFQPQHRPPSFWNTLSKVWLTRAALKEFDRRHIQEAVQQCYTPIPSSISPNGPARPRLKRFARRRGPDLSHLRGVRLYVFSINIMVC